MVKMKRSILVAGLSIFVALSPAAGGLYTALGAVQESVDETPVDFVLVLDCSGSMNKNDPQGLTREAAKTFVNMLPEDQNVRLSVVAFGDNYGGQAFDLKRQDSQSGDRVKLAFPLQDITGQKQRSAAKGVIDEETRHSGQLSPVGYALETGTRILEEAGSAHDNAAIILLSDGQVEGQADGYNAGMDFDSIDSAVSVASSNGWQIYCMELNYREENREGNGLPGIAFYQMRRNIPARTGTEPIELKSSQQATDEFNRIFERFFHIKPEEPVSGTIDHGQVSFTDALDGLIAERNIQFSGQISEVTDLEVKSPSGKTLTFENKSLSTEQENISATFGNNDIVLKILAPESGDWTYVVHGTDNVEIIKRGFTLVDTGLKLMASRMGGEIPSGTVVSFKARYVFGDNQSKEYSGNFYSETPAKLYINGAPAMDMVAETDGYSANYTFEKKGAYNVYARVEGESFRNGFKKSGDLRYTIDNEATVLKAAIPDVKTHCGAEAPAIDLRQYFDSPDGDMLHYTLTYDKSVQISDMVSQDGILTMKAGSRAGSFPVKVSASDGSGETPLTQTFTLEIENSPLELIGDDKVTLDDMMCGESNGEIPDQLVIDLKEYFLDPDGYLPRIAIFNDEQECIEPVLDPTKGVLVFRALKGGSGTIEVTALDENDLTNQQSVKFRYNVLDKAVVAKKRFRMIGTILGVLAVAVAAFLIFMMTGRKIYGTWDIISDGGGSETERKLGATGSGKKGKCYLDSLLNELDLTPGFGNVMLQAGNRLSGSVFLTNLVGMDVDLDGEPVEDEKQKKKLEIRPGHEVHIRSAEAGVTLMRLS